MEQVGAPKTKNEDERALRLDVPTFAIIGHLVELGLDKKPMVLDELAAHFKEMISEKETAQMIFDALVEDDVLMNTNGAYGVSNAFLGCMRALQTKEQLQISRRDLAGGKVDEANPRETAVFFGERGKRYSMLPFEPGTGEVLLCHPDTKELRLALGALLGESVNVDITSNIPISPR